MADKYYRLVCLISNICTETLRVLFLKLCQSDPTKNFVDLQNYLGLRQTEIYRLKNKKIIRDDQYELLYPRNGSQEVANWDVTLLVTVIKNLFKNRLSHAENFTLEEMRDVRNKLQHVADTSQMPDKTYDEFWNRLQSASTTLARQVSGSTYENEIDEKIKAVRINNMPDLGDALKKFFEEDRKQMLVDLRQMAEELRATKDTVDKMKDSMEKMEDNEKKMLQKITDLQTKTDTVVGHSAESYSILRGATVTKVGAMGEAIKRFKSIDQKLLQLRTKFQNTMSQLPGDFFPTYGVSEIKDKLQRHHHVVVSGSQGSRYLETALFAIKNLEYVAERCVVMTEPSEWDHIDPEDVDLVVCRNPFGNHVYDKDKAKAIYGKFDSILLTVKPLAEDKHVDFILITDSESLMEFEVMKQHELLEVIVKLFAPTSLSRPEDLTVSYNGYPAKGSERKGQFARQMTDIYLARDSSHPTTLTLKSAKLKLRKNKFLLISGPPNSGKTALAVHLASSYQPEAVLVLSLSSDIEQLDFNTTSMVIIDEFVGKRGLVKSKVHGWFDTFDLLHNVVRAGKLNVIIICETENLRRCIEEIGPHPMLTEPENLAERQVLVKQEYVPAIDSACRYISGTEQNNWSFPSANRTRSVTSISQYCVQIPGEKNCYIEGCCMLPNDEILLLDNNNESLKKLDSSFRVTSTCNLRGVVVSMYSLTNVTYIGNSEAVVCAGNTLMYVNVSGNMSIRKTVKLGTNCRDVTCRNDRLYVSYNTSIHICTLEGDTVSVLPVLPLEESRLFSRRIAVANDGRMYVTGFKKGLICLHSSGYVINTLLDVVLSPVCVDDRGNVWAGGYDKVCQLSADGACIRNTLSVTFAGLIRSLCYDKHRSSLIICDLSNNINVIGLN